MTLQDKLEAALCKVARERVDVCAIIAMPDGSVTIDTAFLDEELNLREFARDLAKAMEDA